LDGIPPSTRLVPPAKPLAVSPHSLPVRPRYLVGASGSLSTSGIGPNRPPPPLLSSFFSPLLTGTSFFSGG